MEKRITIPFDEASARNLQAGDRVLLTGYIYTGRDAAHIRLNESLKSGIDLPFDLEGQVIYYVGPSPTPEGAVIGSAGPTSSYRMDDLTPELLKRGLKGMIGKGNRTPALIEAMKTYGAVYFAAVGGAGALIATKIVENELIAWEDLGAEAIRRLKVVDLPVYVVIDADGNNMYETERMKFAK